jgi:hypothetical protein
LDNNGTDRDCDAGFSDILSHEKPTEHAAYSYKKTIDQRSKTTFSIRVAKQNTYHYYIYAYSIRKMGAFNIFYYDCNKINVGRLIFPLRECLPSRGKVG